jgi:nucleotidyltransferase/DNA polymerase involved in DNA repair
LANEIAFQIRDRIKKDLGYNASAGISHNKTVAKIACTDFKPNGQSLVPTRYYKVALAGVPVKDIRMLGGKLGKQLRDAGIEKMGDV